MFVNYNKIILLFAVFIGFFSFREDAQAHHCRIETPNINFGKVDPLRIEGVETPAAIKLNCWAVTSPTHYCITVRDNVPERILSFGKYEIPFNFYYNNIIFGSGGYGQPITGTIEPIRGQPTQYPQISFSAKLGRAEGMDLATGRYTGNFQTIVYGAYGRDEMTDAEKRAMCDGQRPSGTSYFSEKSQSFKVSAKIEKSCSVTATNINFGKVTELAKVKGTSGRIKVRCSAPTQYQIGLSLGDNSAGKNRRAMKCATAKSCGSALINYNLYQDAAFSRIWNSEWNTEGIVKGSSANETASADFFALVEPGQDTVSTGLYQDRIMAEVRWN